MQNQTYGYLPGESRKLSRAKRPVTYTNTDTRVLRSVTHLSTHRMLSNFVIDSELFRIFKPKVKYVKVRVFGEIKLKETLKTLKRG